MDHAHKVTVILNRAGRGTVQVDGEHIPHLTGLDFSSRAGELSTLELHIANVEVEFEGDAFVHINPKLAETLLALGWTPPDGHH